MGGKIGNTKKKYKGTEKIEANTLRIRAYIELSDSLSAEKHLIDLLKFAPEDSFSNFSNDLRVFRNKYEVIPLLAIGFSGGINFSPIRIYVPPYGTDNTLLYKDSYNLKIGYQFGLEIGSYIRPNLEIRTGIQYGLKRYEYLRRLNTQSQNLEHYVLNFTETQQWLDIPLIISYDLNRFKFDIRDLRFLPFAYGGIAFHILQKADLKQVSRDTRDSISLAPLVEGSDISITQDGLREMNNLSLISGIGVKLKLNRSYIKLSCQYDWGLTNIVNPENRFNNQELLFRYAHVDNDFRLDNLKIILTYTGLWYRVTKKNLQRKLFSFKSR